MATALLSSTAPAVAADAQHSTNTNTTSQQTRVRMLKHFQVEYTLGSGLQGKVKLGIDTTTQERVALKIIDCAKLNRKSMINVYREVEAMSRVNHANVLKLKGVYDDLEYTKSDGTSKQVIMIVLELATGGELFDFMMYTGCFSESIARAYFQQLVFGLEECHKNGVYHRDIKPENLLLDENFALKIADFGLSGLREGANGAIAELYTQCGTRSYMSPEVLSCLPYEGEPADVWSAGVVLFIMLAGFPPFQIATRQDWWFRACAANQHDAFWAAHARSAVFSQGAMALMTRIFCVNPQERITLQEIKAHPWFIENTVSVESFRADLLTRKMQVEEEKRKEREQKRQNAGKQVQEEEFNPFDANVHRSLASSIISEDGVSDRLSVASSTFSDVYSDLSKCKGKGVCPAPMYPKTSVAVYTTFQSKHPPAAVQARVEKALTELSARFVTHKDRFKTKAVMKVGCANTDEVKFPKIEDVGFTVRIYSLANAPERCVVECRRTSGSCLNFQEAYKKLSCALADLVWDPKEPSSESHEELISDEAMMI